MIYNIYSYKDKRLGVFANPIIRQEDFFTISTMIERSIVGATDKESKDAVKPLIGRELHFIGTFDDETGIISIPETMAENRIYDCDLAFAKAKALDEAKKGA